MLTYADWQTLWFPDVDGTIITTANVQDITHLRGLEGMRMLPYADVC